jgi:arsenate reductase
MKRKVLILCTGNSCRSQMAEAIVNDRRGDSWQAFSAGTQPANQVHPKAIQALAEIGINHNGTKPKHIEAFLGQAFDLIITVCDDAAENCPMWPGQGRRVHIGFPDPAKASGTDAEIIAVFRQVRDAITDQIPGYLDGFAAP